MPDKNRLIFMLWNKKFRKYLLAIFLIVVLYMLVRWPRDEEVQHFHRKIDGLIPEIAKLSKIVEQPNGTPLKFIILALTDRAFVDMTLNLYLSSFKRFNISNYLFVGAGLEACHLVSLDINCVHYTDDPDSRVANSFGTKSFIHKINIRTGMILDALLAGYTVLHTDLDVIFLKIREEIELQKAKVSIKESLPQKSLQENDMAILWDYQSYNAGFLAVKPTNFSITVYRESQYRTNVSSCWIIKPL
ncbi:hypothetical protein HELRODRAFT_170428 [Helobdella robusta]|uniref:Nucleotide-diphospho-sugar transferase domain-containing protein n=1 Tax=Helobdella robusta TaxID=6412 RepID=T1F317_HELRO|nr:hypothetical protein HELRODRAFT_170428 [Helobdella robusta]ESO07127.1 hypothetical protein HELRODRAFT_170428 [Helobdella robusta]